MKKRNILTLILVLIIILFKIDVNAATCTTTEKSNLKKLARMIEINAVLNAEENVWDEYFYEVTFSNWNENFYIVDKSGNTFYKEPTETENSLYGMYQPGSVETFNVYAKRGTTCAFTQLATIRVSFPYYNRYHSSPVCVGIEEFSLCQRSYSGKIESQKWFEQEIAKYKKSLEKTDEDEPEKLNFLETIEKYVKDNPWIIIVVVIVIIAIVVTIVKTKKENKKRIKVDLDLK